MTDMQDEKVVEEIARVLHAVKYPDANFDLARPECQDRMKDAAAVASLLTKLQAENERLRASEADMSDRVSYWRDRALAAEARAEALQAENKQMKREQEEARIWPEPAPHSKEARSE